MTLTYMFRGEVDYIIKQDGTIIRNNIDKDKIIERDLKGREFFDF